MYVLLFVLSGICAVLAFIFGINIPQKTGVRGIETVANLEAMLFCCTFIISAVISFVGGLIIYDRETRVFTIDFEGLIKYLDDYKKGQQSKAEKREAAFDRVIEYIDTWKKAQQSNTGKREVAPERTLTGEASTGNRLEESEEDQNNDSKRRRKKESRTIDINSMILCRHCGTYYWHTNKVCPECKTPRDE